jgi:alpha-tubulin suppressor-like RCC1 family protein
LGDGSTVNKCQPVAVCCNYSYRDVSGDSCGFAAVKTDCTAVGWGYGTNGLLGNGGTSNRCQPVAVCCNYTYKKVSRGLIAGFGIKTDGTLVSWGASDCGQLGDGSTDDKSQPVAVCCNYTYREVNSGLYFAVGIRDDGTAVAWGNGSNGVLGNNDAVSNFCVPVAVCCNYKYKDISVTNTLVAAIKDDNTGILWGTACEGVGACGTACTVDNVPSVYNPVTG